MHWRRQRHPTAVLLLGKSHGRVTTERLHFHFSLLCIGEGNGNPLQYSCLENPRDGGAWWAAVSGVTQSWTRLKRLSSSSSSRSEVLVFDISFFYNKLPYFMILRCKYFHNLTSQKLKCFTSHSAFLLLVLLSRFSRVQLCATPETAAHQAPPSLGFSRQEHWSGLPFPSPRHESEK